MANPDGKPAALVGAIILLIIAAANLAYGVYRAWGGHEFELPLITGAVVCAGMAAVLFSRAKSGGR